MLVSAYVLTAWCPGLRQLLRYAKPIFVHNMERTNVTGMRCRDVRGTTSVPTTVDCLPIQKPAKH